MIERIASCDCGKVRFRAVGRPIATAVCYCDDCQAGAQQMEALGATGTFRDAWRGTPYMSYRDGCLSCIEGSGLLEGVKLRHDAPTTRFITTCCRSPIYLKYGPGWWVSVYRLRFGAGAAPIEFRSQTQHVARGEKLPGDVPVFRSFPPRLIAGLLKAGAAQLLGIRSC